MKALLALSLCLAAAGAEDRPCVVIVVGAPGAPNTPASSVNRLIDWQAACQEGRGRIDPRSDSRSKPASSDHERLKSILAEKAKDTAEPLWIVLIGHGTYDGREAKFNLRGPDMTDVELSRVAGAV